MEHSQNKEPVYVAFIQAKYTGVSILSDLEKHPVPFIIGNIPVVGREMVDGDMR